MRHVAAWKLILIAIAVVVGVFYLWPTIRLAMLSADERAAMDPDALAALDDRALKLGLDLSGGMYLLLEVDKSQLSPDEARDAVDRALEIIRNRIDEFGVSEPSIQRQGSDRILVQLPGLQDAERAKNLIGQTALLEFQLVEEGLPELLEELDAHIPASLRLAEGLASPEDEVEAIAPEGKEEGVGEEPGESEPEGEVGEGAAPEGTPPEQKPGGTEEIIETPWEKPGEEYAEEEAPLPTLVDLVAFFGQRPDEAGLVMEEDIPTVERLLAAPEVQEAIPEDVEIAWGTTLEEGRQGNFKRLYLLKAKAELTGAKVSNATVRPDPDHTGSYMVSLKLTRRGSRTFHRVTRKNVGRHLAVVLDGKVSSAPEILSPIPGVASITGGFTPAQARDLAIILRAGRLPAPLKIIEERTVGPSLGADSIRMGVRATIWGGILVLVFMVIYYRLGGLIASVALIFNLVLLLAIMAALRATLTLPGIAGVVLTVGMAVDANVLIFERIREELRQKKTPRIAIENGYSRALVTILDANLTTLLTALVLLYFGTASIKGFAVTLSIGLVVSMFTALLVTRVIFDAITARWRMERLSI